MIEAWLVDPDAETVSVYRPESSVEEPAATLSRGETLSSALLPGLEVDLEALFAALP